MSKTKITLTTVFGSVLWESEKETVKEAVLEKYKRDANLYGADLRGADLRGANLRGANLYGADLRGANLRDANLYGANLYGANLRGANLYGADLRGADLRGANLRGANLYGADLRGANLRDANLYGANLYGANLYGANLYGANLYGADQTTLPQDYINQASRDILFILGCLKGEVAGFKQMLIEGKVDGSAYENSDCVCLIGSLARLDGGIDKVCKAIPFYEKGTQNAGENFFLNIKAGDRPETNWFSKHAVTLCDIVLAEK
jgi:hypothetical protein